ncbi:hypothetical protein RRG08_021812 [Elysia crispata]|uniref:Uncharacterized protein n=1 Tax=Elysia crispata TaxID=231223 RepID=A0AAE1A002_9GAST|nr:hypothetical protein RRG08_021812 [Elysia crispata]
MGALDQARLLVVIPSSLLSHEANGMYDFSVSEYSRPVWTKTKKVTDSPWISHSRTSRTGLEPWSSQTSAWRLRTEPVYVASTMEPQ